MSSMRNAVQRRQHRERGQLEGREKWGILEKHKVRFYSSSLVVCGGIFCFSLAARYYYETFFLLLDTETL